MTNNKYLLINQIFHSLSGLFSKPESLDVLSSQLLQLQSNLNSINPELSDKISLLTNNISKEDFTAIQVEFAKLFIGPFGVLAVPYGSFYMENGIIMGESTKQAKEIYEISGLEINNEHKEVPDHIQTDLEFLYFISHVVWQFSEKNEVQNIQAVIEVFEQFIEIQMQPWIRDFTANIRKNAVNELFIVLADALDFSIYNLNYN